MNLKNLSKLADFVEQNVTQEMFNMSQFRDVDTRQLTYMNLLENKNCGTVGCLLGWAPFASIDFAPVKEDSADGNAFCWFKYCERVFGFNMHDGQWDFLFGGEWEDIDNTVGGAADRIRYLCENPNEDFVQIRLETADEDDDGIYIPENFPIPDNCEYV